MPLTALTMFISTTATLGCWLFVSERLRINPKSNSYQARLLAIGFLFSIFYGIFMLTPHLLLYFRPESFPLVMSVSFVIGHVFLYFSFLQMMRLTFSLLPQLNNKQFIVIIFGILAVIAMVFLAVHGMVLGTRPSYNTETHITTFNVPVSVNSLDTVVGLLAVVPAAILLIINGFAHAAMRTRSFLIGGGMIALMITGPLVEGAHTISMFVISNTLSVLALLILTVGIAYRMEQRLTLAKANARS
jgi:hypothetical protein